MASGCHRYGRRSSAVNLFMCCSRPHPRPLPRCAARRCRRGEVVIDVVVFVECHTVVVVVVAFVVVSFAVAVVEAAVAATAAAATPSAPPPALLRDEFNLLYFPLSQYNPNLTPI